MNVFDSPSDLSLLAFRYAAGELNDAEAAEFEGLLETNQDSQLALARAVQLATAVQSVGPAVQPVTRMRTSDVPTRRWAPVLAVIGSAIVAATLLVALREESAGPENSAVTLWSELHEDEMAEPVALEDASLLALEADTADEDLVPDWMLVAVAIDDGSDSGVTPGDESQVIDDET